MSDAALRLQVQDLEPAAFAPYGEVIETGSDYELINQDSCRKYADLASIDAAAADGRLQLCIYRAQACRLPLAVALLERHPLSSQTFVPLDRRPFLVVVAAPGETVAPQSIRVFRCSGRQGVNYHRGTWHHPLLALEQDSEFLVLERKGPGQNCDLLHFDPAPVLELPASRGKQE